MQLDPFLLQAIKEALNSRPAQREIYMSDAQVICARLELLFNFQIPTPQVSSAPDEPLEFIPINNHMIPYLDMRISQINEHKLKILMSSLVLIIFEQMRGDK